MPKITVDDIDINYQIQGSGSPLLVIMGLSFSLLDWGTALAALLAPYYQLILFDNRDAGQTSQSQRNYTIQDMADDTAGLLEALNIPKAHIFGVSMGGAIAQELALRHPTKVDKLILGCTFAGGTCSELGDFSPLLNGNLLDLLFTPEYIRDNPKTLDDFLKQTQPLHSKGSALQRQMQAIATHNTCDTLDQITAETLVITGDRDIAIPQKNSETLDDKIPNATLEIIPEAAHAFSYSHANETAKFIRNFLQQTLSLRKTMIQSPIQAIKKTFGTYAQTFNLLEPAKVVPFFHLPAMLMTVKEVEAMQTTADVETVFTVLMEDLKHKNFAKSEIIGDLKISQLSDNQGQVVGAAKRFDNAGKEIEYFGFTYTLRKTTDDEWKIIAGVLHEPKILIEVPA
jgi:3-oxoadipate enol-lactonase